MSKTFLILLLLLGFSLLWFKLWSRSFEQKSLYYPDASSESTPKDIGLEFEDLRIKAADGVLLSAWYVPYPNARWTVLFLHGNAGNIAGRLPFLEIFHRQNLACLILDYRGYGKSEGKPSEKGLYSDADAAYEYLLHDKGVPAQNIILFGESLGAAVAVDLAARNPVGALLCESPFSSILDMAGWYHPYLPARLMVSQRFDSLSKIKKIQCPFYVVHSSWDEVTPFSLGKKLFDAAPEPKRFYKRLGQHSDVEAGRAQYEEILKGIVSGKQIVES